MRVGAVEEYIAGICIAIDDVYYRAFISCHTLYLGEGHHCFVHKLGLDQREPSLVMGSVHLRMLPTTDEQRNKEAS